MLSLHGPAAGAATGPARRRTPLSRDWLFGPSGEGGAPDGALSSVDLPHTAAELSWRQWDPASWERRWLYRKHFESTTEPGLRHYLRFAGALTAARPVLNGHVLPEHAGGYLPFQYEVGDLLRRHNTLDVVVDGSFRPDVPPNHGLDRPSSAVDFWQPAGLYREVELVSVPVVHIADVFARPYDVLAGPGLRVRCELDLGRAATGLRVDAELRRDGTAIGSATTRLPPLPAGRHEVALDMPGLTGVELWSVDAPALHDVVVTLCEQERPVHDHSVRTGFREARFERSGFYLNGERLQLFGLNRHQFHPFAGGAMPARVQRRDAEILRDELNCNMVRCSHYPQHEEFLDACDELGLLVWDEPPGWQYLGGPDWLERAYRDVHDMIVRDRNHPSVVLWGVRLNETPGNAEFYTRTQLLARSLDDSRQTTGAMHGADHGTSDFQHDVFGYNDYSASTARDGTLRPELAPPRDDLPYLVSEAIGTLSGPSRFYRRTDPQDVQQGQALAHARVHDRGRSDQRYAGVLAWAGIDYPSGNGNVFLGVKWPGVVDLFRIPKPGAAMYRAQVDPRRRPVIEPSFYWDLGPPSPVTELGARAAIWSNLERLELYLDGAHHATLAPAREEFPHLPHPPFFADLSTAGDAVELRVDGALGGRVVLSRRFSADRSRDRLSLRLDGEALRSGGIDATRAELRAVDEHGAPRAYVSGAVTLELDGPAVLVGSNPFPLADTGGAGAVWLRSTDGTGTVRLRARHPTLGAAEATLVVGTGAG
ncbi:glycoside hydrolase family 2 TIM barrel-domain containing protein [Saccharopolyspora spinosporotrichia]|uniref:Glycoside hydrolase family 2 TIM barrel-domain containing protein n=1 Tax=Saccharopolyspora erythraea TaxID=1836 RepID=A0ABP3MIB6_SACER